MYNNKVIDAVDLCKIIFVSESKIISEVGDPTINFYCQNTQVRLTEVTRWEDKPFNVFVLKWILIVYNIFTLLWNDKLSSVS